MDLNKEFVLFIHLNHFLKKNNIQDSMIYNHCLCVIHIVYYTTVYRLATLELFKVVVCNLAFINLIVLSTILHYYIIL